MLCMLRYPTWQKGASILGIPVLSALPLSIPFQAHNHFWYNLCAQFKTKNKKPRNFWEWCQNSTQEVALLPFHAWHRKLRWSYDLNSCPFWKPHHHINFENETKTYVHRLEATSPSWVLYEHWWKNQFVRSLSSSRPFPWGAWAVPVRQSFQSTSLVS